VHNAFHNGPFAPATKNADHSVTMPEPPAKTPALNGNTISNSTLVQPGNALQKLIEAAS
jgi:hypothetical protein